MEQDSSTTEDFEFLNQFEDEILQIDDVENPQIAQERPKYWGLTKIYTLGAKNEPYFPKIYEVVKSDTLAVSNNFTK